MNQDTESPTKDDGAESAMAALTGALIDANDQLLALYALTEVTTDSLDGETSVREILDQAKTLLEADALILNESDGISITVGTGDSARTPSPVKADPGLASTTASVSVTNESGGEATLTARRADRPFGTADHKLLTAVANVALGAVHTSRLHGEAVDQAVVSRDHDTASQLAVRALPSWKPEMATADLFARSDPARAAGGDLYTYAEVDNTLHFVVGDVSGKGLPAAMMMTNVISASLAAFHGSGESGPSAVLSQIDSWLYEFLSDAGLFVTLVVGAFNQTTNELRLANAGHSPVMWISNATVEMVEANVPPIGVLPLDIGPPPEEVSFSTHAGDRLVVASDGFTEQENPDGVMFGEDRLTARLTADPACSSTDLAASLYADLETYADGSEQGDDRTVLILSVTDEVDV